MALLSDTRAGFVTALNTISGLNVLDTPRDRPMAPAVILIAPEQGIPSTFAPSRWEWTWRIQAIVTRVDLDTSMENLDVYVSSTGSSSITAALLADPTLGGNIESLMVTRVGEIGEYTHGETDYLGAEWTVEVITSD